MENLGVISDVLGKGILEVLYSEIEKRGVRRENIPNHISVKLSRSVFEESIATLSVVLRDAIEEMRRTGLMKEPTLHLVIESIQTVLPYSHNAG